MASISAAFTGPEYYDQQLAPISFVPFARDLVDRYGCDSERVQELLTLFSRELQPTLMQ